MKTTCSFLCLFLVFTTISFAQQLPVNRKAGVKKGVYVNTFWDNCFIQVGAGGQVVIAEDVEHSPFSTAQITFIPAFAFGKWIRPWVGLRAKVEGGALHSFHDKEHESMHKDFYYDGHLDLMVNISNLFWKYDPKRNFDVTGYGGVGYYSRDASEQEIPVHTTRTQNDARSDLSLHAGLLFEYHLNKRVGFHVDIAGLLADDYFNRIKQLRRYDGVASVTMGFTFHFGKPFVRGQWCQML